MFLVGLAEGTLPTTYAKTPEALEEERRLLYVGITRARRVAVAVVRRMRGRRAVGNGARADSCRRRTSPEGRRAERRTEQSKPWRPRSADPVTCRICGAALFGGAERKLGRCADCPSDVDEELYGRLLEWRGAHGEGWPRVPAYVVFTDATLTALAERQPTTVAGLIDIAGIGPRKLGMYGEAVLALVGRRERGVVGPLRQ